MTKKSRGFIYWKKNSWRTLRQINNKIPWVNLAILLVSVIIFCLAAEGAFRLASIRETNWFGNGQANLDFYQSIKVNQHGFRDIEYEPGMRDYGLRIALIGDSFVYGSGVLDDDKIFPNILEERLNLVHSRRQYELMNIAWPGANTADEGKVLFLMNQQYYFNKAILFFFPNDVEASVDSPGARYFYKHLIPGTVGDYLFENSYFYYFAETRIYRILEKLGLRMTYNDYIKSLYDTDSEDLKKHREVFDDLLSVFNRDQLVIVIIPVLYNMDDYEFSMAHDYVKEMAANHDIRVIDLLHAFRGMDGSDLIVNQYDYHFNEKAHSIVADYLYDVLSKMNFFEIPQYQKPHVNPEI